MKKIIFYIALIISILLLVNIANILISDLNRLTQYGYGFLSGKILLFVFFGIITFFTRKYNSEPKTEH